MTDDQLDATGSKFDPMIALYQGTESRQNPPSPKDEELDFASKKFNPLKALYTKKLEVTNDRKFDNVSSLMAQIRMAGSFDADLQKFAEQRRKKKVQEAVPDDAEKYHVTAAGRKFLKEQGE